MIPNIKSHWLFIFIGFILNTPCFGQNINLAKKISQIDSIMYTHQGRIAIPIIDSLLKKKLPINKELHLKAFKLEALVQINEQKSALNLSNEILKNPNLKGVPLIRTYIERALIYELATELKESHRALEFVKDYYKKPNITKDELYGEYLYRLSSLYRMEGLNEKGLVYAKKAVEFGRQYQYKNVEATGLLLTSALTPNMSLTEQIELRKRTIKLWQKSSNYRHIYPAYFAIARYYNELNKNELTKKYLDSGFYFSKKIKDSLRDYYMLATGYTLRSSIFEKEGDFKNALESMKLTTDNILKSHSIRFNQQVSEANAKFNYEKETLKNKALEQNLTNEKRQKNNLIIGLIIVIFLLSILVFLAINLTKKRREIKVQSEIINNKNLDLTIALDKNKLLLRELNHRVNNNLALILSLVKFQYYEIDEPKYKEKFQSLEHRIKTIAAAHEQLLYNKENLDGENYDVQEYLSKIANALIDISIRKIELNLKAVDINLNIDTLLPVGILVNEFISNSLKHAVSKPILYIGIQVTLHQSQINLTYKDSGTEFKEITTKTSLGVNIIHSMVKQLKGTIQRVNSEYQISLQLKNSKKEA